MPQGGMLSEHERTHRRQFPPTLTCHDDAEQCLFAGNKSEYLSQLAVFGTTRAEDNGTALSSKASEYKARVSTSGDTSCDVHRRKVAPRGSRRTPPDTPRNHLVRLARGADCTCRLNKE